MVALMPMFFSISAELPVNRVLDGSHQCCGAAQLKSPSFTPLLAEAFLPGPRGQDIGSLILKDTGLL
jgi:hypothetical protein